jgi:predicted nuclease with TOPRIM domain
MQAALEAAQLAAMTGGDRRLQTLQAHTEAMIGQESDAAAKYTALQEMLSGLESEAAAKEACLQEEMEGLKADLTKSDDRVAELKAALEEAEAAGAGQVRPLVVTAFRMWSIGLLERAPDFNLTVYNTL